MKKTQARRLFDAFGGVQKLCAAFLVTGKPRYEANVYRWDYPRDRTGTGGVVPTNAWPDIFLAAEFVGVEITPEMLDPREK